MGFARVYEESCYVEVYLYRTPCSTQKIGQSTDEVD
jgi:hypothetical protein